LEQAAQGEDGLLVVDGQGSLPAGRLTVPRPAGAAGTSTPEQAALALEGLDAVLGHRTAPAGRLAMLGGAAWKEPVPLHQASALDGLAGVEGQR